MFSKSLKVENFLYNAYQMVLFLKNVFSALLVRFSGQNQKTLNVAKIRNYDEERVFFREKNVFIFLQASLQKWEGAKYAGGSRLAVLFY